MRIVADRSWMNQGKPERSPKRQRSRPALSARGPRSMVLGCVRRWLRVEYALLVQSGVKCKYR